TGAPRTCAARSVSSPRNTASRTGKTRSRRIAESARASARQERARSRSTRSRRTSRAANGKPSGSRRATSPRNEWPVRARCLVRTAFAVAGVTSRAAARESAGDGFFDYVYVEPNSGSASGGHVAVVFGDVAFHFQHIDAGLIGSVKEPTSAFE